MKAICLTCFWVNAGLAWYAVANDVGIAPVALALVSAGLCLAGYLQK
tara:strand:+ start:1881 stop:2021 length:141 start_codon:yes stop_codon:yes gene_type:complete